MARQRGEPRRYLSAKSCCRRRLRIPSPFKSTRMRMVEEINHFKHVKSMNARSGRKPEKTKKNLELPKGRTRSKSISPFLNLPRELRDQIYEYLLSPDYLGSCPSRCSHDSIRDQARFHAHSRLLNACSYKTNTGPTALLCVNRQVQSEALRTLHASRFFIVHMDRESPIFALREGMEHYDTKKAIPCGWHPTFITKLVLRIDLGQGVGARRTMTMFKWPTMSSMISLKHLQLMLTYFRPRRPHTYSREQDPRNGSLTAIHRIHDPSDDVEKDGTLDYKVMMTKLFDTIPTSVRELALGVQDLQDWISVRIASSSFQVEGEFLWQSLEGLESFCNWRQRVWDEIDKIGKGDELKIWLDSMKET